MNEQGRERALRFRVGVFVIVALAAFVAVIYVLGARARLFEARYTIHADFTEVGGLREGATVRLAGVQIGRVTDVHLPSEPGGKVRVDLTIGRQFADRIRKDSVARIETQGLLGDRIVEISVGTAAAPVVQAGDALSSSDPTDITPARHGRDHQSVEDRRGRRGDRGSGPRGDGSGGAHPRPRGDGPGPGPHAPLRRADRAPARQ
jgi:ABC-type transporter Mla subunit MlaD